MQLTEWHSSCHKESPLPLWNMVSSGRMSCSGATTSRPSNSKGAGSTLPVATATASPINGFRLAMWNIHSLRHKYITVADNILTVLQLTLWFVDLHRRATPTLTAQECAPRLKIVNLLQLNPTKALFIWFSTHQQLTEVNLGSLAINIRISPSRLSET